MRKRCVAYNVLRILSSICIILLRVGPVTTALADEEYVPGEVVILCEGDVVKAEKAESKIEKLGFEVNERSSEDNADTVIVAEVPTSASMEEAIAEVESVDGVILAQPNYVYRLVEPSQSVDAEATALNDTYQKYGLLQQLSLASVLNAWDLVRVNRSVSVAVIDTGCRLTHEDLTNNVDWEHAWDFLNGDEGIGQSLAASMAADASDAGDGNGHGTHVCGVIAAEANNGKGVAGSSYNATLIPMRALDAGGSGTSSTIASALERVLSYKRAGINVRVVNLSIGHDGSDRLFENMIAELAKEGILCVCAAGNEDSAGSFAPADAPDALSVMALDKNLTHTYYTNYKTGSKINTSKTVSAMGGGATDNADWIWSTYDSGDSTYGGMAGTSQAAPVVSGIAALVFAANPSLTTDDAREILVNTADPVNGASDYSYKDPASAGAVNAYKAVVAAGNVRTHAVAKPTARDLVYTGVEQVGVAEDVAYELKTLALGKDGEPYEMANAPLRNAYEGARGTKAGTYQTFAHLRAGYEWNDGTTADQSIVWQVRPASLAVRYADVTVLAGESVPTEVQVSGFVNGESAATAAGYQAPTLDLGGAVDASGKAVLPAGEQSHGYAVALRGGEADNYEFTYECGTVTVVRKLVVGIPKAQTCVYNGKAQMGVPDSSLYTITGKTEKNAGTYRATLRLVDTARHEWSDATTAPKVVTWSIQKAPLTLRYNGGKALMGTRAQNLPSGMTVEGFVGGESAKTLTGFTLPELAYVTALGQAGIESDLPLQSSVLAQRANQVRKLDDGIASSVGAKHLVPAVGISGFSQGNPTANYEFREGQSGELTVYGKATLPSVANKTYNGRAQQGVDGGSHCVVTGTRAATAAGTYSAKASPEQYYIWSDKSLDDAITDRNLTWKISAANIGGASVTVPGGGAYTGAAKTPAPTVKFGSVTLRSGRDYTVSYKNNVNVGTATVTVTGKGNYTGSKKTTFAIVAPTVSYRVHVQKYGNQAWKTNGAVAGTVGQSKRLEGVWIQLGSGFPISGGIEYRTHVQTYGWQEWRSNGMMSGTSGQSKRLEAIQIRLKGNMATHYDIYYRVHAQKFGWMGWAKNGAQAGTAGYSYRLEGIQVVLVPKNGAAPGSMARAFRSR